MEGRGKCAVSFSRSLLTRYRTTPGFCFKSKYNPCLCFLHCEVSFGRQEQVGRLPPWSLLTRHGTPPGLCFQGSRTVPVFAFCIWKCRLEGKSIGAVSFLGICKPVTVHLPACDFKYKYNTCLCFLHLEVSFWTAGASGPSRSLGIC